jgi:two-component sensor histidine kinase
LSIYDDGVGIGEIDKSDDTGSLGMDLIKGLATDLRGQLKIEARNGTSIRVLFEINILDKAASNQKLEFMA